MLNFSIGLPICYSSCWYLCLHRELPSPLHRRERVWLQGLWFSPHLPRLYVPGNGNIYLFPPLSLSLSLRVAISLVEQGLVVGLSMMATSSKTRILNWNTIKRVSWAWPTLGPTPTDLSFSSPCARQNGNLAINLPIYRGKNSFCLYFFWTNQATHAMPFPVYCQVKWKGSRIVRYEAVYNFGVDDVFWVWMMLEDSWCANFPGWTEGTWCLGRSSKEWMLWERLSLVVQR